MLDHEIVEHVARAVTGTESEGRRVPGVVVYLHDDAIVGYAYLAATTHQRWVEGITAALVPWGVLGRYITEACVALRGVARRDGADPEDPGGVVGEVLMSRLATGGGWWCTDIAIADDGTYTAHNTRAVTPSYAERAIERVIQLGKAVRDAPDPPDPEFDPFRFVTLIGAINTDPDHDVTATVT